MNSMQIMAERPEQYLEQLAEDRKQGVQQIREAMQENLPEGFTKTKSYGMIG